MLHQNTLQLLKTGSKVVVPVIWNNSSGKSFEIGSNYRGVIFSQLLVLVWQAYKVPSLPIPQPVKVDHTTRRGLPSTPTLFEQWRGFFYVPKEQISESAVTWDLRFFVLIREE